MRYNSLAPSGRMAFIDAIARNAPRALDTRCRWEGLYLGVGQQLRFARQAVALRWRGRNTVEPWELLQFRPEQSDGSLWSVFNAVQEALLGGGVPFRRPDGSRGVSRAIASAPAPSAERRSGSPVCTRLTRRKVGCVVTATGA
jgi:hypothetical protein